MLKRSLKLALLGAALMGMAVRADGIYARVSGSWQQITNPQVRVSGTWQPIQQGWVRVSGVWQQFFSRSLLETTITVGDDGIASCGYSSGTIGSIGTGTYTDAGSNSRTISTATWGCYTSTGVRFTLSTAGISNTDSTFTQITINGAVTVTRSSATYDGAASGGTRSSWVWSSQDVSGLPSSGSVSFVVQ